VDKLGTKSINIIFIKKIDMYVNHAGLESSLSIPALSSGISSYNLCKLSERSLSGYFIYVIYLVISNLFSDICALSVTWLKYSLSL